MSSISGTASQAGELTAKIEGSIQAAEQLSGVLMGLSAEAVAAQVNVCKTELEEAVKQTAALVAKLEQCAASAEAAKSS